MNRTTTGSETGGSLPYKVVAVDMDGTLLSPDHTVSKVTQQVILQLIQKGVHFIFATGRPFTDVARVRKKLDLFKELAAQRARVAGSGAFPPSEHGYPRCFLITTNGTRVFDEDNQLLFKVDIPEEACRSLLMLGKDDPDINVNVFRSIELPVDYVPSSPIVAGLPLTDMEVAAETAASSVYTPVANIEHVAADEWVCRHPAHKEAMSYKESNFSFNVIEDIENTCPTSSVNSIFFLCDDVVKHAKLREAILQVDADLVAKRRAAVQHKTTSLIGSPNAHGSGSSKSSDSTGAALVSHATNDTKPSVAETYGIRLATSTRTCIDVIPKNVSKATGLRYVGKHLGVDMTQDCIAFGDAFNDVEMLEMVKKGCLMGNAMPGLRERLPGLEVIGSNAEDGVARKLAEVFGLNMH